MCKQGLIHLCLIIDESGSMYGSENDIIGGFNKTIDEQKAVEGGECVVSYFKFSDDVTEVFIGKDVNDVKKLTKGDNIHWSLQNTTTSMSSISADGLYHMETVTYGDVDKTYVYSPHGCTAMNDGIGTAIDKIGKWLSDMPEEERPSKNMIVIMTDGEENSSKEYTLDKVKNMIQHQTEKYNWTFVYMGMDITSKNTADGLGIFNRSFSSKSSSDMYKNYDNISASVCYYRMSDATIANDVLCESLTSSLNEMTHTYEAKTGLNLN